MSHLMGGRGHIRLLSLLYTPHSSSLGPLPLTQHSSFLISLPLTPYPTSLISPPPHHSTLTNCVLKINGICYNLKYQTVFVNFFKYMLREIWWESCENFVKFNDFIFYDIAENVYNCCFAVTL